MAQGRNSTGRRLLISPETQSPTNRPPPTDPVSFSHFLSFHLFCLTQLSFRYFELLYYTKKTTKLELLPYSAPLGYALLTQELEKLPQHRDLQEFCVLFSGLIMLCFCCLPCLRLSCFQCPLVSLSFSLSVHIALSPCNSTPVPIFKHFHI